MDLSQYSAARAHVISIVVQKLERLGLPSDKLVLDSLPVEEDVNKYSIMEIVEEIIEDTLCAL